MKITLQVVVGGQDPYVWEHAGPLVRLGRGPRCELQFKPGADAHVSWEHAAIELKSDGAYVSDSGSTNGTFLNDQRVQSAAFLRPGDRINLGHTGPRLTVEAIDLATGVERQPAAAAPAAPRPLPAPQPPPIPAPVAAAAVLEGATDDQASSRIYAVGMVAVGVAAPLLLLVAIWATRDKEQPVAGHDGAPPPRLAAQGGPSSRPIVAPPADSPIIDGGRVDEGDDAEPADPPPIKPSDTLARQAHEVLRNNCYRCHGEQGSAEGGLDYILDRQRLVAEEKVVPGNVDGSSLLARVIAGEMPPAGESPAPSADDVALLKQWVAEGAADFSDRSAREFITDDQFIAAIAADLEQSKERDRRYLRYFTLTHLHNAGATPEDLQNHRLALAKLINSLSWSPKVRNPRPIDAAQTVLRIDLRDYQFAQSRVDAEQVWQTIAAFNPYAIVYDTPAARRCYEHTLTETPWVRADWFVFKASQPPLYETVLGIPQTDAELESLLKVNAALNIRQERVARAGFNGSGVSQNNRLIERHESSYGAYWKSYDFGGNVGTKNLFLHPLGPANALPAGTTVQAYEADGGELIFNLPNGLQGYMLADANGQRIDKGPTAIVKDPRQPDATVTNGVSCMSCHYEGIIRKEDEIRGHVSANLDAFADSAEDILALYPPKDEMARLMEEDRQRFRAAVVATGNTISKQGEPVYNMARRFDRELDLPQAAAEAGLKPDEFLARLAQSPRSLRQTIPLSESGGTVKRQVYTDAFGELVVAFRLGRFVPPRN
jgi:hypothetical protein